MANKGDFGALERMIATARSMATLAKDAAPIAARLVGEALRATATAGQAPDGKPWPLKKDGSRALAHAAAAITTQAIGTVIVITLRGAEVFHHFGAQGKPRRQVIPQGSMPARLGDAVRLGFVEPWKARVKK